MEFSIYRHIDDDIEIDGVTYTRNATFDNILNIIKLSNDNELSAETKILTAVYLLFGQHLEDYTLEEQNTILEGALQEYLESKEEIEYDDLGEPMPGPLNFEKKLMDIDYDATKIYSSFLQAYSIDLHEEIGKMHWYKFKALLSGLPEKTALRELIQIRGYKKASKNDDYHMKMMELQRQNALPAYITGEVDEFEEGFDEEVNGYGDELGES